jgi:ubiquinone/menaquinone biosynthesis C-methylase UbiE
MAWDEVWEKLFAENVWGKYPSEALIRFVARNFYGAPNRGGVKLLELGCGPGANMWYAAREGFSVYGIDGSETGIRRARERLDAECAGWQGELRVGDFSSLPYPDESFDAVLDEAAIYCNGFEQSQAIYREAWRVLKPSGRLYSRTFAEGCIGEGTGRPGGRNAWFADIGPLAGKGLSRFTKLDEIGELLGPFQRIHVEYAVHSISDRSAEVRMWLIEASKSAS